MKKAACDELIDGVAADLLTRYGYVRQKWPNWIRAEGHFFVEMRICWSRGYYRIWTAIGCDLIP